MSEWLVWWSESQTMHFEREKKELFDFNVVDIEAFVMQLFGPPWNRIQCNRSPLFSLVHLSIVHFVMSFTVYAFANSERYERRLWSELKTSLSTLILWWKFISLTLSMACKWTVHRLAIVLDRFYFSCVVYRCVI